MNRRKEIVEHPFRTIKRIINQWYFLGRGSDMARTELHLKVIAYNKKRAINILGGKQMVQALA